MKKTLADRARATKRRYPNWKPTKIAAHIGGARNAVEAALAVQHERVGRPGVESRVVRLSAELLDSVAADAKRKGIGQREWIEEAIRTKLRAADPKER